MKSIKSQLFIVMATAAGLLLAAAPARAPRRREPVQHQQGDGLKGTITMFK